MEMLLIIILIKSHIIIRVILFRLSLLTKHSEK